MTAAALTPEQGHALESCIGRVSAIAADAAKRFAGHVTFDEAYSSAALGACKATSTFEPDRGASLSTWIHRRAWGQVLDDLRSRSTYVHSARRRTADVRTVDWAQVENGETGQDPHLPAKLVGHDTGLRAVDEVDAAEQLICRITSKPSWRAILRLRFIEGLTHAQTAQQLGCSESLCFMVERKLRRWHGASMPPGRHVGVK